ncbi:MAG: hypothetical protein D6772_09575, partial [Bacteroidetes bacterium]
YSLIAMLKNKLILLLQSLSSAELSRLDTFLASDYFNPDPNLRRLFSELRAAYPDFAQAQLTKAKLFAQVYPDQPYNDKALRYALSRLNQLAEQFLAWEQLQQQAYQTELALLEALSQRGLEKSYRHRSRLLERQLAASTERSSTYFLASFQWAELQQRHFQRQHQRRFDESIQHAAEQLDRYYFLQRLRLSCAMLDRERILHTPYRPQLSADWLRHLRTYDFFSEPVIALYHTIYGTLQEEQEEHTEAHFQALKSGITQTAEQVPHQDLRDIYLFAINFCARKIRQGADQYVDEALLLYRMGIERGILLDNGQLSPWTFTNVVKLLLRQQQYADIESFITQYGPTLPPSQRANALHYNRAELYYYTKRFDDAQTELLNVAYSDPNYYLGARVLLAKIYYETQAEEALLALLASFTIFLKRNRELAANLKQTYLNFCHLLFQIVRRPAHRLDAILSTIQTSELLTDRAWLTRVCEEKMQKK